MYVTQPFLFFEQKHCLLETRALNIGVRGRAPGRRISGYARFQRIDPGAAVFIVLQSHVDAAASLFVDSELISCFDEPKICPVLLLVTLSERRSIQPGIIAGT